MDGRSVPAREPTLAWIARRAGVAASAVVIVPAATAEIAPYLVSEIFFREAVAFPVTHLAEAREFLAATGASLAGTLCLDAEERAT